MGFIDKNSTKGLTAYLTQRGRELLLTGDKDEIVGKYFLLGDSDRNYTVSTHQMIKSMPVPDLTGDKSDSVYSLASNIEIKHWVGTYKELEQSSASFEKKLVYTETPDVSGVNLNFMKSSRIDVNADESILGNLYSTFNLPITSEDKTQFTSGKFLNTALSHLNKDNVVVIEIPKNYYGELIDGKSVKLRLPQTTGYVDIYSSFFKHSLLDTMGDVVYSDLNEYSKQFGGRYNVAILPGQHGASNPVAGYSSNIAYLFCDAVQKPRNVSTNTWANNGIYFNTQKNVPSGKANKFYANYDTNDGVVDKPVGIIYLDKGFIVLTDETLISKMPAGTARTIAGTTIPNFYYPSVANLSFESFNTEFIQHAVCICLPNEFYTSNNPTFVEQNGANNDKNAPVAITEVGIFNKNYEMIAIAKSNAPIAKDKISVLSFDISIRV